jgi:hypothetical protein
LNRHGLMGITTVDGAGGMIVGGIIVGMGGGDY